MPNFKRIGGGSWKNGQKSVDLIWNDPLGNVRRECAVGNANDINVTYLLPHTWTFCCDFSRFSFAIGLTCLATYTGTKDDDDRSWDKHA